MSEPPPGGPTLGMQNTPNAERYVLEADAMRRRQLRSALLHGSQRNWRDHVRTWPAVVVGIIAVAVIVAGLAVTAAFQKTNENEKRQEREQQQQSNVTPTPTPAPSSASASASKSP
jgi:hypothetical protein